MGSTHQNGHAVEIKSRLSARAALCRYALPSCARNRREDEMDEEWEKMETYIDTEYADLPMWAKRFLQFGVGLTQTQWNANDLSGAGCLREERRFSFIYKPSGQPWTSTILQPRGLPTFAVRGGSVARETCAH